MRAVFPFVRKTSVLSAAFSACLCGILAQYAGGQTSCQANQWTRADAPAATGCVGSAVCAQCHRATYASYSQTDMGRSMSEVNRSLLSGIPTSASVFNERLNRHFETYEREGNLYQSEFELSADGKEVFRDTHRVEWVFGAGANGFGAIVRRGNYLFEAPLSFYSSARAWGLSPGYEFADYGFRRPILPGCIVCHSGRPQPVIDGNGRFEEPPFQELAIGCENCHGPGAGHVFAMQTSNSPQAAAASIVNPARLSPWLADNICLECHQTGDARVLQPGKRFSDFRPGAPLDRTLSIFMVPFDRQAPPQDDLLEHFLLMRLSKCYRGSGGKLACISCHDPHTQPSGENAATHFRGKCLRCHTEKSCTASPELREKSTPTDNCVDCHMPKRKVRVISHSVLTNHRIIARPDEPFPDAAFQMTTAGLPDLIHLSGQRDEENNKFSRLTLLQAYRQVMLSHPEYRERYWALAKQLEGSEGQNVLVLQGLADLALQRRDADGVRMAIRYLQAARKQGSLQPADFELLAKLVLNTKQEFEAIDILKEAIELIPYDPELYRLLASTYISLKNQRQACEVARKGNQIFPEDANIRSFLKDCAAEDNYPSR